MRPVRITPGLPLDASASAGTLAPHSKSARRRARVMLASIGAMTVLIGAQLLHLAWLGQTHLTSTLTHPIAGSFARPDIVDRNGHLLANDVRMPSLFADPSRIRNVDRVLEQLVAIMPDLDAVKLRGDLANTSKRFVWVRRGVAPAVAQHIHNLGLPGLSFKHELRRAYPATTLAGHVLGAVNVDNKGLAGLEAYVDAEVGVEPVVGTALSDKAPVRSSLHVGAQHVLQDELNAAMQRYSAKGAAGVVMDVNTGEVIAASSLPAINPMQPGDLQNDARKDKVRGGTYELGSIFKVFTVAMALETGLVSPDTQLDVTTPIVDGAHVIRDAHRAGRPLTVAEVFTRSSNVGTALLALAAGPERHRRFLKHVGLIDPIETELGDVAAPQVPDAWQRIQQITIAFGHGIAVAPLQFAAAAGAVLNGGRYVTPTFLKRDTASVQGSRVLSEATSHAMRRLMRMTVTDRNGTGRRAAVRGYDVGGKTGTAELPGADGYRKKSVIASFVGAFPMSAPRYLVLVSLFEPKGNHASGGAITAGRNAAPTTARIIERIAPMLNVAPQAVAANHPIMGRNAPM